MYTVLWLRFFLIWLRFLLTLIEVFPCFFLSCKVNVRVKLTKTGHGPHSSTLVVTSVFRLLFVLFYVLFVCKCVLPPGKTQLQLINISYHISYHIIHHISYRIISYHIISYHIISYHIISYHIISYHIVSYHTSYHIIYIIYHIVPHHIISYHIISYHITFKPNLYPVSSILLFP